MNLRPAGRYDRKEAVNLFDPKTMVEAGPWSLMSIKI
jgi:hypothetical protein